MRKGILKNVVVMASAAFVLFGAVVFADLSAEQQTTIDTAAVRIVAVMNQRNVTPDAFRALLDTARTGFGDSQEKWDMADALDDAVMDAFYQVDNFNSCEVYYDGCNNCSKTEDGTMACTLMMCVQHDTPACLEYKNSQAQIDLDAAKALWMSKVHSSYTVTIQASCFCTEQYRRPVRYEVVEGQIHPKTAVYADKNEDGDEVNLTMTPNLLTVEGMFSMVQDAIDANADAITVVYNSETGSPMSIDIDSSFMIADEEQHYTFDVVD